MRPLCICTCIHTMNTTYQTHARILLLSYFKRVTYTQYKEIYRNCLRNIRRDFQPHVRPLTHTTKTQYVTPTLFHVLEHIHVTASYASSTRFTVVPHRIRLRLHKYFPFLMYKIPTEYENNTQAEIPIHNIKERKENANV